MLHTGILATSYLAVFSARYALLATKLFFIIKRERERETVG